MALLEVENRSDKRSSLLPTPESKDRATLKRPVDLKFKHEWKNIIAAQPD